MVQIFILTVKSDLGQYIDRRFREEGVEIPFPQSDLHLRSIDERIFGKLGREAAVKKAPRGEVANAEGAARKEKEPETPAEPVKKQE